jgi:hypothetical protein
VIDDASGIEEGGHASIEPRDLSGPTMVRGVLFLGVGSRQNTAYRAELLDISGRKVMELVPGPNDVTGLSSGIYFVRAVSRERSAVSCQKVVIQH